MSKYDDIINLERPISKRCKMSLENRAAQFAPYAALSGHAQAIRRTAKFAELRSHRIIEPNND